jgi:hypothetical protein
MARKSDAGKPRKSKGPGKRQDTTPGGAAPRTPQQMTSEDALKFIRAMQKEFPKTPRTNKEKDRLQEYLARFTDQQLKAVGRRVQGDLMLRPPRTIQPDDYREPQRRVPNPRRRAK